MSPGNKGPSIAEQVITTLYNEGPMDSHGMMQYITGVEYKSVSTQCLQLEKQGLILRGEGRVWSLREGVTPQTLIDGTLEDAPGNEEEENDNRGDGDAPARASGRKPPQAQKKEGIPLDQKQMFIQELKNIGVQPKEAIPTIASLFFDGDIDDLGWLNHVLLKSAAGFVNHKQRRLIMDWWSHSRGLPYAEDEMFPDTEPEARGKKPSRQEEKEAAEEGALDAGVGWRVEKDRDGEWVAVPGGPVQSYMQAQELAKQRQVIAAYSKSNPRNESDDDEQEEEGRPARRSGRRGDSIVEKMMLRLLDGMLDGNKGKGSAESETIGRLTDRIEQMERDRNEERFERMEGLVAQALARDPWDDYDRINKMKERLGGGGPVVTDQSPAVQLIKDSTDKLDKNVGRLVGIVERVVLREGDIKLEETRSPEQREQKADELLGTVQSRNRSRGLRRSAFGV